MKRLLPLAALALAAPVAAQEAEPVTPASIVAAATPDEWVAIDPADLLVMDLTPDAAGQPRQVIIQLLPAPSSQPWVENIRTLASAHWWDGTSVYRVVDNWVVQWGAGEDADAGFAPHPVPEGVVSPAKPYTEHTSAGSDGSITLWHPRNALVDAYADWTYFVDGWPIGAQISEDTRTLSQWPVHCYGSVGVARDLAPDTGTGSELYAVIGHAPRQLDRNIAVVGRVIDGIAYLSTLPRGTGEAGVYTERSEDTPIVSVRLGSDLPEPPRFEYLGSDSASFAAYVQSRANRHDAFYEVPAGGLDVCNVQVPIRPMEL